MHRRGHKAPEQLALTVAMAYLSFYVANGPCALLAHDSACARFPFLGAHEGMPNPEPADMDGPDLHVHICDPPE